MLQVHALALQLIFNHLQCYEYSEVGFRRYAVLRAQNGVEQFWWFRFVSTYVNEGQFTGQALVQDAANT
jgi:hypothetical protein